MEHLALLFFLFSIFTGFLFIGIFSFLSFKNDYPLIRIHLGQLIFYTGYIFFMSVIYYGVLNTRFFNRFDLSIHILHTALISMLSPLVYYMPRAFYFVAGVNWTKKTSTLFKGIAVTLPILSLILISYTNTENISGIGIVFFLVQCWCYYVMILRYRSIEEPILKFIAKIIFFMPFYSIPIGVVDYLLMTAQSSAGKIPYGIMGQPLIYFINNILSFIVLLKAHKLYQTVNDEIPHSFLLSYRITDREKDIITLLERGLSNKEIASKLFLSPSTVRNHLSAIFEKCNVNSRTKLISLIKNTRKK